MHDPTRAHPCAVPCLLYGNPAAAADWLDQVLGFRAAPFPGEQRGGAAGQLELERDGAVLVLGRSEGPWRGTRSHTRVVVDDVDEACLRALCAGGAVDRAPAEQPMGVRRAVVSDPEGNRWELTPRVPAHT
jgi:uncharacterized glyoxalase superfamily protein PhnB